MMKLWQGIAVVAVLFVFLYLASDDGNLASYHFPLTAFTKQEARTGAVGNRTLGDIQVGHTANTCALRCNNTRQCNAFIINEISGACTLHTGSRLNKSIKSNIAYTKSN